MFCSLRECCEDHTKPFFFLLSLGVPCVLLLLLLCVCEVLHSALEVCNCGYLFTCNSFIIFLDSNKSHTFQVS